MLPISEVNAFDPLESLSDTILHVELTDVDQNLEALGDERCVEPSGIIFSICELLCYGRVELGESVWFGDVEFTLERVDLVGVFEHILEWIRVWHALVIEIASVHLVNTACGFSDVVEDSLSSGRLLICCVVASRTFLAYLPELLDLLNLEVIIETDRISEMMLFNTFCWDINKDI